MLSKGGCQIYRCLEYHRQKSLLLFMLSNTPGGVLWCIILSLVLFVLGVDVLGLYRIRAEFCVFRG